MSTTDPNSERRATAVAATALRVMTGVILATHGALKLMDISGTAHGFQQLGIPYAQYAVYLAIAGELFGGIGLILGLLTRVAALGTLATMAVAIGYVHFGHRLLAKNGGWEYPLVLGLVSLFFVTNGGGPASLDALFARRRETRDTRDSEPGRFRERRVRSYA